MLKWPSFSFHSHRSFPSNYSKHYLQSVLKRTKICIHMYQTTTKQHCRYATHLVCDIVKDNPHYQALLSTFKHLSKSAYDAFAIWCERGFWQSSSRYSTLLNTLLFKNTRYIVFKHFRFNSIMCHEKNQMMSNENKDMYYIMVSKLQSTLNI